MTTQVQGVDYEVTGLGRIVQGDLETLSNKDAQGNVKLVKSGPNKGQEAAPENFFAVAFPKMVQAPQGHPQAGQMIPNPDFARCKAYLEKCGKAGWPTFWPNNSPTCVNPNFSFKITDGDGYDNKGIHNATKEGFAGCWVLKFSSQFLAKRFYQGRYQPQDQITEPGVIKRGDYVRVIFTSEANKSTESPGVFVRASSVELCHIGNAIVSASVAGPDASTGFGAAPAVAYVPQGASAVQVPAGQAPAAAAFSAPPATPAPQQAPAVPGQQPEPYSGYIPTPEAAPAVPAAPVAPVWSPAGWTQHPQNPQYWYMGTEVITEAELRARQQ